MKRESIVHGRGDIPLPAPLVGVKGGCYFISRGFLQKFEIILFYSESMENVTSNQYLEIQNVPFMHRISNAEGGGQGSAP